MRTINGYVWLSETIEHGKTRERERERSKECYQKERKQELSNKTKGWISPTSTSERSLI